MKPLKIISIIVLALLVLVSSTNFMIGIHYCQGKIDNVSLFAAPDKCENEEKIPPCHRPVKTSCCDDEMIVHAGEDFKASAAHIQVISPIALDIEQTFILIAEVIPAAIPYKRYFNYDPPLRSTNIIIEHQVFLI